MKAEKQRAERIICPATLTAARENWSRSKIVRESKGRRPNRAKFAHCFRTQQQRAFAACILHSVRIYDLWEHEYEIRAMLHARGMLNADQPLMTRHAGVRPCEEDVADEEATDAWLLENVYVAGTDNEPRKLTANSCHRLRLTDDSAGRGHVLHAREQLKMWAYLGLTADFSCGGSGCKSDLASSPHVKFQSNPALYKFKVWQTMRCTIHMH